MGSFFAVITAFGRVCFLKFEFLAYYVDLIRL